MLETLLTGTNPFDSAVMAFIQEHLRSAVGDAVFPYITYLGEAGVFWLAVSLVFFLRRKTRLTGVVMVCAVAFGFLFGEVLVKNVVCRPRPFHQFPDAVALLVPAPHGFSFPSGHSCCSFTAATGLFLGSRKWGVPALILAALIAFSRVYLFVHWPTDVLTGILLGVASALLMHFLLPRLTRNVNFLHPTARNEE